MSDSEPFDLFGWANSIPDAEIRAELERVDAELRRLQAKHDLLVAALTLVGKLYYRKQGP